MKIFFKTVLIFLFLMPHAAISESVKHILPEKTFEYQYSRALYFKSEGKINQSIKILKNLINQNKNLDRIYYQLSDCYFKQINFKMALKFSQKSIKINPNFSDPYILNFKIYNILKNYERSADTLYQLLKHHPELTYYHYLLGRLYTNTLRNFNMGSYIFLKLLASSQESHLPLYYIEECNYNLFKIFMKKKQYTRAIDHLNQAANINSKYKKNFLQIADFFTKKNLTNESARSLELYLQYIPAADNSKPLLKKIYAYLGRYYYIKESHKAFTYLRKSIDTRTIVGQLSYSLFLELLQRDKSAKKELSNILKKMPKSTSANIALARIYKREKSNKLAYKHFYLAATILYKTNMHNACRWNLLNALSLKPDQTKLNYSLGELYEKTNQLKAAIYHFKKFYKSKNDIEILLHIAYLYSLLNDNNKSQDYFIEAQKIKSDYARTYFFQGLVATRRKNYLNAEQLFDKAIQIKNNEHSYYFYLALAQEKQKKVDKAISNLKHALKYDKKNPSYSNYLGYLYTDKNINIDEALILIKAALKKEPYNGAYLDSLGWVYYRQGKYQDALLNLLRAERNLKAGNTPDSSVFDHIGETYLKIGKKSKAIEYWEKALFLKKDKKIENKIKKIAIK